MYVENSILAEYFYIGLITLVLVSFIAGYIDAIAGGAGLILIPSFLLVGLPPQIALGQEKLVSTIGTLSAIKNFVKSKSILWRIVPYGIVTGLIGAYVGAKAILWIPVAYVYYIVLVMLPIGLIATFVKARFSDEKGKNSQVKNSLFLTIVVCFVIGFYDGFFGPGTGSLFIIMLHLINNLPLLQSSATSKIFNFSSNVGAFIAFFMAGKMLFLIGIPMILSSFIGNYIGSRHAIKTDGRIIKKVLSITTLILVLTVLYKLTMG